MILHLNHTDPKIASAINALQKESYLVESQLIKYPHHPNLNQATADIQNSHEIFFGYYIKKDLAGVISYETESPTAITICRLIVKPSKFGKGIAGELINSVEKSVHGLEEIYVQTGKDNVPAINRYKKSGFHLIDEYHTSDGLALVKLYKRL